MFFEQRKNFSYFLGPDVLGIKQYFYFFLSFRPICFRHKALLLPPSVSKTLLSLDVLLLRTRSISYLKLVKFR